MRLSAKRAREDADVPLTPLIDCVFLLLIFFLVTSMLKRWEMIIPVQLPDTTSSLSATATEEDVLIGLSEEGQLFTGTRTVVQGEPRVVYAPIADFAAYLQELASKKGIDAPILLSVDRRTPMQTLIDAVDTVKIQGFSTVSVKTRERAIHR